MGAEAVHWLGRGKDGTRTGQGRDKDGARTGQGRVGAARRLGARLHVRGVWPKRDKGTGGDGGCILGEEGVYMDAVAQLVLQLRQLQLPSWRKVRRKLLVLQLRQLPQLPQLPGGSCPAGARRKGVGPA